MTTATVDGSLEALNLPVKPGVLVQDVQQGSPADKAGLRGGDISAQVNGQEIQIGGDIITEVDGKAIATADDLASVIQGHEPGDKVKITYLRDGDEKTAEVTLAKLPRADAGIGTREPAGATTAGTLRWWPPASSTAASPASPTPSSRSGAAPGRWG